MAGDESEKDEERARMKKANTEFDIRVPLSELGILAERVKFGLEKWKTLKKRLWRKICRI